MRRGSGSWRRRSGRWQSARVLPVPPPFPLICAAATDPLLLPAQRYADYENDIRVLEAKLRVEQRKNATPSDPTATTVAQPSAQRPGISRFNSFMSTRKASPSPINGTPPAVGGGREKELEEQLIKEQTARIAAEKRANEVSAEIEDLSATLFEQANEMVATERKQNSALKTQLQLLEEQQRSLDGGLGAEDTTALQRENERLKEKLKRLEEREGQRQKRLQRLEEANRRIERVRTMLKPP